MSYEESISTKMNDLDLAQRSFKVMSTIASHSPLKISETVRDRGIGVTTVQKVGGTNLRGPKGRSSKG